MPHNPRKRFGQNFLVDDQIINRIISTINPKNNEIIDKELNTESSINKRDKIIIHTVKKGDTLIKIAKKYTTTVAEIQRINKLKTTTIQINQILKIK